MEAVSGFQESLQRVARISDSCADEERAGKSSEVGIVGRILIVC